MKRTATLGLVIGSALLLAGFGHLDLRPQAASSEAVVVVDTGSDWSHPALPEGHPPILPEGHPPVLPEGHPPIAEGPSACPYSNPGLRQGRDRAGHRDALAREPLSI